MAKRVTAFVAADGTLFVDPAACANYEKTTLLAVGVAAALGALGFAGALVVKSDDKDGETAVNLQDFLIANSEVLVEALNNQPPKAPRKAREPKAQLAGDGAGLVVDKPKDIAPIVIKDTPADAPVVVVAPADEAGAAGVEDELNALLGGDSATATEVAL